jgi:uncharacterized protein YoxC
MSSQPQIGKSKPNRWMRLKSKLPLNGDWLFVTIFNNEKDSGQDLAEKYFDQDEILSSFDINADREVTKVLYERAVGFDKMISDTATQVRDKAKTLFGGMSIVSAILFGVTSLSLSSIRDSSLWLVILACIFFVLMSAHFGNAISRALRAMIREQEIHTSTSEYLELSKSKEISEVYRLLFSKIVAYANKTHDFVNKRVNSVIIAQHAFGWGLFYFSLLFILLIVTSFLNSPTSKIDSLSVKVQVMEGQLSATQTRIDELLSQINMLEIEMTDLQDSQQSLQNSQTSLQSTNDSLLQQIDSIKQTIENLSQQ